MRRFSPRTEAALRDAGWEPSRSMSTDVERWVAEGARAGAEFSPAARRFLIEFGGLVFDTRAPGRESAAWRFSLDPLEALDEIELLQDHAASLDVVLAPIGVTIDGWFVLGMAPEGSVYAVAAETVTKLGPSGDDALMVMLEGLGGTELVDLCSSD